MSLQNLYDKCQQAEKALAEARAEFLEAMDWQRGAADEPTWRKEVDDPWLDEDVAVQIASKELAAAVKIASKL